MEKVLEVFEQVIDKKLSSRRITITACNVITEQAAIKKKAPVQLDIFTDYEVLEQQQKAEEETMNREKNKQQALIEIKNRYGKNAILKGMNFTEGATARERNNQIGGHKA